MWTQSELDAVVREAQRLDTRLPSDPNIFQIARIAHKEDVTCNLLAFLLHAGSAHGMNGLAGRALALASGVDDFDTVDDFDEAVASQEVLCEKTKSLDLCVVTPTRALIVEVKVLAQLSGNDESSDSNQLKHYAEYARKEHSARKTILVLLAPAGNRVVPTHGFVKVTFQDFFGALEKANWRGRCDARYVAVIDAWMSSVVGPRQERWISDEARTFLRKHWAIIEWGKSSLPAKERLRLVRLQRTIRKEFETRLLQVEEHFKERSTTADRGTFYSKDASEKEVELMVHEGDLMLVRWYRLRTSAGLAHIECCLSTSEWQISVSRHGVGASKFGEIIGRAPSGDAAETMPNCWNEMSFLLWHAPAGFCEDTVGEALAREYVALDVSSMRP